MDESQAKIILANPEGEPIEEVWEERLFAHKQFFLTRPPIQEVWLARLKKMNNEYKAFCQLTNEDFSECDLTIKPVDGLSYKGLSVIEAYNAYFQLRNKYKADLIKEFNPIKMSQIICVWLASEKAYYEVWNCEKALVDDLTNVLLSKEPDPMELLAAIRDWQAKFKEATSFDDLCQYYTFLPELLKNEVKRLTSLYKRNS